jgi:hypothetical protein
LSNICRYDYVLYLALTLEVVFLIFAVLSYLFAFDQLDPGTRYILLIDFALLGVVFVLTVSILALCHRRS